MDILTQTITLGGIITVGMFIIAFLNYRLNKINNNKKDKVEISNDEARLVRMETMLVNIEKNTSNLNSRVNDHDKLLTKHETRISVLEEKLSHRGDNA